MAARRWPNCCGSPSAIAWSTASTTPSFGDCAGLNQCSKRCRIVKCGRSTLSSWPRAGERQVPVCLVARELRSGRTIRLWQDQFGPTPPFPIGADVLFVAYYASAELGCFRALGWPMPARILDLFAEFRDSHQRPAHASRRRAARCADLLRPRRHRRNRESTRCATWCCAAARGRARERSRDSRLLRERRRGAGAPAAGHAAASRSAACACCAAATWRRPPPWSTPACRSTADAGAAAAALDRHPGPADRRDRRRLSASTTAARSSTSGSRPGWREPASPGRGSRAASLT